jgi:hypothetical protein
MSSFPFNASHFLIQSHRFTPSQAYTLSGLEARFGNMTKFAAVVEKDPTKQHDLTTAAQNLLDKKVRDPSCRIRSAEDLLPVTHVNLASVKQELLQAPDEEFVEFDVYVKEFGLPKPSMVEYRQFDGRTIKGVRQNKTNATTTTTPPTTNQRAPCLQGLRENRAPRLV